MKLLTWYLWLVMAGLLLQGGGSLLLDLRPDVQAATPYLLATVMNGNPPHAVLHIVWGAAGLAILALFRSAGARLLLGLVFGLFYTGLGFLGIAVHDPFGMRLMLPENVFHLTVGPLMLVLTYLARRGRPAPAPATA
ncbi:MAG TPA: DUF4383 domain-containing protein [Candidatus Dormibacteraeota bacterium]